MRDDVESGRGRGPRKATIVNFKGVSLNYAGDSDAARRRPLHVRLMTGGIMARSRAEQLRDRVEELRLAAEAMKTADGRKAALIAAEEWERIARWEEEQYAVPKRPAKQD
jgi:ribosomal protein S7